MNFADDELNPMLNKDKVLLSGIRIRPHLGVDASERNMAQDCDADVAIWGNCESGVSTDDLSKALDYTQILAKVLEIADCREYVLLETLAYSITKGVLQAFPVAKVSVKVRKRPASLAGKLDYVEVEIEASR
jgi:7,8-dihydroneopterin aldolase/epimerase/oxygenase